MIEFLKSKWPEIAILAVLIPFAGGGFVWALNTGERIAVQENRTQQIIASLPDLRTRVAHTTVFGNFETAVVFSEPFAVSEQWFTQIQLVDANAGEVKRFRIPLADEDDGMMIWSIYGRSMSMDQQALNFQAMESMATTVEFTKMIPPQINERSSFVSYTSAKKIESVIEQSGAISEGSEPAPLITNWPALMDATTSGVLAPKR